MPGIRFFPVLRQRLCLGMLILFLSAAAYSQTPEADLSFYQKAATSAQLPLLKGSTAKNVILLIGDGMSLATVSAARLRIGGTTGSLHMDRMPVGGFVQTSPAGGILTDSAAAATALATGHKTLNGRIAVSMEGQPLRTLLEEARQKGLATGLVVTSSVTDATPAAFAAHVVKRSEQAAIAEQLINCGIDVLLGGGKNYFIPQTAPQSQRKDEKNLMDLARNKGYQVVESADELKGASRLRLLGLFAPEDMKTMAPEPSLVEMEKKALATLAHNRKGFFLMVEGSLIDKANHLNQLDKSIRQTLLFDEAVQLALTYAQQHRDTLVVVTADHETGGLSLLDGKPDGSAFEVNWGSKGHTSSTVPLYAFGPGALQLSGFHDNTQIAQILVRALGLPALP